MTDASSTAPHTKRTSGPGFWKVYTGGRIPNAELQTNMLPMFLLFTVHGGCLVNPKLPYQEERCLLVVWLHVQTTRRNAFVCASGSGSSAVLGFCFVLFGFLAAAWPFTHKVRVVKSWPLPAGPAPSKAESCSFSLLSSLVFLSCLNASCWVLTFQLSSDAEMEEFMSWCGKLLVWNSLVALLLTEFGEFAKRRYCLNVWPLKAERARQMARTPSNSKFLAHRLHTYQFQNYCELMWAMFSCTFVTQWSQADWRVGWMTTWCTVKFQQLLVCHGEASAASVATWASRQSSTQLWYLFDEYRMTKKIAGDNLRDSESCWRSFRSEDQQTLATEETDIWWPVP